MNRIACVALMVLLVTACGGESSKVNSRLSIITNGNYQPVHDGDSDVTGGTILAAMQGKEPPINFEAVMSVPGPNGRPVETRLTFAIAPQQNGKWELYFGTSPVSVPGESDYQKFLKAASEKIADIYNAEREKVAKANS